MTFGYRIKQMLQMRNMTQKQLSKELTIPISTLNGYIQNTREPDYKTLILICEYFGVTTDYILGATQHFKTTLSEKESELINIYQCLDEEKQTFLLEQARMYHKHMHTTKNEGRK